MTEIEAQNILINRLQSHHRLEEVELELMLSVLC